MSDEKLLVDSASKIFSDHCDKSILDGSEIGSYATDLDSTLAANGFFELARRDSGFSLESAFLLLREAGKYAVPIPMAEILLGARWINQDVRASVGVVLDKKIIGVPWASKAEIIIGVEDGKEEAYKVIDKKVVSGKNIAGESREEVLLDGPVALDMGGDFGYELLALARVAQTVGALERILDLTLSYANEREQFGRPIAKFQAIQHNLAILAGEVAAAVRAGDAGIAALSTPRQRLEIASSKARVNEAAGVVVEIAHQVHGAMGFTHEHQLHHFTRRAWAWREEFGNEIYWRQELGQHIAGLGPDGVWPFIATRG